MIKRLKQKIKYALIKYCPNLFPFLFSERFYSQYGEDKLLLSFFDRKQEGYKGFYVDVGAHNPFRFSNTAIFYKRGWRGINIEPTPRLFRAFTIARKRDINLNIGISDSTTNLTFYEFNEPGLNNFSKERSTHLDKNTSYYIVAERSIPVRPLKDVLSEHLPKNQIIDFLNVDAEGFDLRVLKSNDWKRFRPNYISVEGEFDAEHLSESKEYTFLRERGYKLVGRTLITFMFQSEVLQDG